ncbi:Ig-like domain-containing protein [Rhodanobacter ginsengisoli]|uniref:Ig-like domain-containing protein n=1 Tax=Rhodanobacter ginsengisoli TaxID=418646 RepID=A0ABW0QLN5_9GAMM
MKKMITRSLVLAGLVVCLPTLAGPAVLPDHQEFDAALQVPFQAAAARSFIMHFEYPGAAVGTPVAWQIVLLDRSGNPLREWNGSTALHARQSQASVSWDGLDSRHHALPAGYYTVRMRAIALDEDNARRIGTGIATHALKLAERLAPTQVEEQRQDIQVGQLTPATMPTFNALPRHGAGGAHALSLSVVASGLPYTIYYGNLHSQTNHSDGGGDLSSCTGAQAPQSSPYGPADAYLYAMNRGLDILMTSEHNHMYDGSTGTNLSADPATAKNLFASGLAAASSFHAAHPDFLPIYGQEWGVISNGGHLNIMNADGLIEWEKNSAGQLIGDYEIAKGDYASLYTLMKTKGWVGQFNHPASSGQFTVNGTNFGYTADGDQVMVLAEVLNSSAFSSNTTETETSLHSYETAFNTILERGYHVAPSSDQDNHCANWGASSTNRTGVLIPSGIALSLSSFVDALNARRVFATEDKNAQIVLTANGHVMGERFSNSGPLTLTVNYASANGQTVQRVQLFEGVPGSNGTVGSLSETATTTVTPSLGDHFYYAKITEANGQLLWSAPVWVTESAGGGDTTPPTVSASESGGSGTITFAASATDNVGVTRVEFYVDGALKATDTSLPYAATLDSTTLADGSHTLLAKAYDAAGNVGSSSSVGFSVSNAVGDTTAPTVSASESGSGGTITFAASATDNVGVTRVEFYVDGALKATDTSSPYAATLDSTTLADGSHTLLAKAYDAAGNVGSSSSVGFSVSNGGGSPVELIGNGGFESGTASWTQTSGVITSSSSEAAHAGSWKAWLDGYGSTHTDYVRQQISIPAGVSNATLDFFMHIDTAESGSTAYDTLQVQVITSTGNYVTLATFSNKDAAGGYQEHTINLNAYKGQTLQINFYGVEDSTQQTSFVIDDVSVKAL